MPLVLGIDEAGYGPLLGPLVIGATLWRVEPRKIENCLWKELRDCVTRKPRKGEWRLHVDDSKTVFARDRGPSSLERAVLAFADAARVPRESLGDFLQALTGESSSLAGPPWYRDLSVPLPIDPARACSPALNLKVEQVMESAGARICGLHARVVSEERFNRRVEATRNKGAVLVEQVLSLIADASDKTGDQDLIVHVDRLGGRNDYRGLLQSAFPERSLTELEISEGISRYRLAGPRNDWIIGFTVEADQRHLPVALASMVAKYVREMLMERFNAFWRNLLPTLQPTAGYYNDAQRFLADIRPILDRSGVPLADFVRAR